MIGVERAAPAAHAPTRATWDLAGGRRAAGATSVDLEPDLRVLNRLTYPTRVAVGPAGEVYVSDAKVGSVFFLDNTLRVMGELKGLGVPLGVAVDGSGRLYVGRGDRRGVEVYSPAGLLLSTVDLGRIQMPNDLALDGEDRLYVVDSRSHRVSAYDRDGTLAWSVGQEGDGPGQFRFPSSLALGGGELFVADQGNGRIQVLDLEGRFLRSFGQPVRAFTDAWHGRFIKPQSLAVDADGHLHVADTGLNRVQVLDAATGAFLSAYAELGHGPAQVYLPLDVVILASGEVLVADAGNGRLNVLVPGAGPVEGGATP